MTCWRAMTLGIPDGRRDNSDHVETNMNAYLQQAMAESRTDDFKRLSHAGVMSGRRTRGLLDWLRRPRPERRLLGAQLTGPAIRRA